MTRLIKLGILPKRLESVIPPPSAARILGTAHRKRWRTQHSEAKHLRPEGKTEPGGFVCVDQLQCSQPGLLPQSIGHLSMTPVWGAQIFADTCSNPPYLNAQLLTDFTLDSTLKAKVGFERLANTFGVKVKHYRADNGRFSDVGFKRACDISGQRLSFCGVSEHHQNGVTETAIRYSQDLIRVILINYV